MENTQNLNKIENYLYETEYTLAGFVVGRDGRMGERYLVGGKAKDLAAQVTGTHLKLNSSVNDTSVQFKESLLVKTALYLKQEDYQRLRLDETTILSEEPFVSSSGFSFSGEDVRNPDFDKILSVRSKSTSISLEFFLLMGNPLKIQYKKEVTPAGISLTYKVLERATALEVTL